MVRKAGLGEDSEFNFGEVMLKCFLDIWVAKQMLWLSVCAPTYSYVEIQTPSVMLLGSKTSGWCLGHEGGAILNVIRALQNKPH